MKRLCTLTVLALTACGGAVESSGVPLPPLISIHLASQEEQPGYEAAEFEGRALFVAAEPVVSDDGIAAAEAEQGEAAVILDIKLTPAGAGQLRQFTAENIGRPIVLRFNGEIVGAPIIRSEITGGRVQLSVPARSEVEARQIVERVRAHWPGD